MLSIQLYKYAYAYQDRYAYAYSSSRRLDNLLVVVLGYAYASIINTVVFKNRGTNVTVKIASRDLDTGYLPPTRDRSSLEVSRFEDGT